MAKMGRPRKPLISQDRATAAALQIIDEQGLEALSLSAVATRLKVKAPSLYHHFHNKADLLAAVARSILREIEVPDIDSHSWEEAFLDLCVKTRRAILNHPNAAPLLLQYFPRNLLLSAYDYWTGKCPYPEAVWMVILDGSEKLTFGSSLYAAAALARETPSMPHFEPGKLPSLAIAIARNPYDDEQLFIETVKIFLAGLRMRYGAPADTGPQHTRTPRKKS